MQIGPGEVGSGKVEEQKKFSKVNQDYDVRILWVFKLIWEIKKTI